jgi:signal transduction histidine kinase
MHVGRTRLVEYLRGRGHTRNFWSGYLVATLATILALLIRLMLSSLFQTAGIFLFFTPAVMVSAWYGGRGPGIYATVLAVLLGNYFLLNPDNALDIDGTDAARLTAFALIGLQISILGGALFSAKRKAESDAQAVRHSEELYRTLASNFPNGMVFLLNPRLKFSVAEGKTNDVLRMTPEEIRGCRLGKALPRSIRPAILPLLRQVSAGNPATSEIKLAERVFLVQLVPLHDTAGAAFVGMGIVQDITELALARESLRSARDLLEARVHQRTAELEFQKALLIAQSNASIDGILVASQDNTIVFHNQRLVELWRLPEMAFSTTLASAVDQMKQRLEGRQIPLGRVDAGQLASGGDAPSTVVLTDGRTLDCYAAAVTNTQGRSYGTVWFFRDVTERRRLGRQILAAAERERERIGQDLHDDLCQHLTGISCLGRVLQQRITARLPSEAVAAAQIVDLVEQAIKRARDLARGLLPLQLEHAGLATSLEALAGNLRSMFGVQCYVRCEQPVSIDDTATHVQLYRIVQEATTNAVRHGKAQNIYIDLVQIDERLILSIEDDGIGMEHPPKTSGLGLRTMAHRANMIGGLLSVESADSGGTIVTCTLHTQPLTSQEQNRAADNPKRS